MNKFLIKTSKYFEPEENEEYTEVLFLGIENDMSDPNTTYYHFIVIAESLPYAVPFTKILSMKQIAE